MHLKGEKVNLYIKQTRKTGETIYMPLAASESCDIDVLANTVDATSKDDANEKGLFENPEFIDYTWSINNESFVVEIESLWNLVNIALDGTAPISIIYKHKNAPQPFEKAGQGFITNLTIDATNGDFTKVKISMEGNGALHDIEAPRIYEHSVGGKIKGKALMISLFIDEKWRTIACSKSHTLSINNTLADLKDKDYNDMSTLKEIVSKSVTLTTNNLIDANDINDVGTNMGKLFDLLTSGTIVSAQFGYYPNSIGQSIHDDDDNEGQGWGEGESILINGDFMVSNLSNNGTVKQDATYTAEFKSKGQVTVGAL